MKKKVLIFLTIFAAMAILLFKLLLGDWVAAPNSVSIKSINVSDKIITLSGSVADPGFSGPSVVYSGYSTDYKEGALLVKIKSRGFLFSKGTSDFNISIPHRYGDIKEIYLWGGNENEKVMVWPENKTD